MSFLAPCNIWYDTILIQFPFDRCISRLIHASPHDHSHGQTNQLSNLHITISLCSGSSDSLENVLISCLLNENNYLTWSHVMHSTLCTKNKLGFIDGTTKRPKEDESYPEQWIASNFMLIIWIFNSLGK